MGVAKVKCERGKWDPWQSWDSISHHAMMAYRSWRLAICESEGDRTCCKLGPGGGGSGRFIPIPIAGILNQLESISIIRFVKAFIVECIVSFCSVLSPKF